MTEVSAETVNGIRNHPLTFAVYIFLAAAQTGNAYQAGVVPVPL